MEVEEGVKARAPPPPPPCLPEPRPPPPSRSHLSAEMFNPGLSFSLINVGLKSIF